jgi:dihydrofolate reductase
MGIVILDMAMSLDGFVADQHGNALYPIDELQNTEALDELIETTGSVVMGRRAYDMAEGDFTEYEYQVPVFVLTHDVPEKAAKGLTFTFVTDGIESALEQAKAAAGEKNVTVIGGANTAQQCIRAGVLDEIQFRLMPVLLGEGLRLFEHLGTERIELEQTRVREFPTRTDIRFRVVQ